MDHADEAPVHISPYDPAWPALFEVERRVLTETLRPWLIGPIEHVGSTAVPGLAAKPVITRVGAIDGQAGRPIGARPSEPRPTT